MSKDQKLHYYLIAADVMYSRSDENGVKTNKKKMLNCVVTHHKKLITYELMNEARKGILQRCNEELNVQVNEVLDFAFHPWTYMGVMSEEEFNGKSNQTHLGTTPETKNAFN